MKALITIIVLALVAWGIWALVDRDPTPESASNNNNIGNVEGASDSADDAFSDPNEFEDKG